MTLLQTASLKPRRSPDSSNTDQELVGFCRVTACKDGRTEWASGVRYTYSMVPRSGNPDALHRLGQARARPLSGKVMGNPGFRTSYLFSFFDPCSAIRKNGVRISIPGLITPPVFGALWDCLRHCIHRLKGYMVHVTLST